MVAAHVLAADPSLTYADIAEDYETCQKLIRAEHKLMFDRIKKLKQSQTQ
jgi:hypothetical protein